MRRLIFAFVCLLLAAPCRAKIITVDDDGLADFNNIQAAIGDSNDGDTVLVADGTYTGEGNRDIDFLGKEITLRSVNGPKNCIIDCNGTEIDPHRGFYFHNNEDANSVLDGFTITNGYEQLGAGIRCEEASATISKCIITGNSAEDSGGGMFNYQSSPMLTKCTFIYNSSGDGGGGMTNTWHSSPILTNCTFNGNSTLDFPITGGGGGGMYNEESSSPTLSECTFSGNSAAAGGGGLSNYWDSSPKLSNCSFSGNSAKSSGGGVTNWWGSNPTLANCRFAGNLSDYIGGGMYNLQSGPTLTNCTFSGNSAQTSGGGMGNDKSSPTSINCTFAGNLAPDGNALACDSYEQQNPSKLEVTNCILWNGEGEVRNNDSSTITITYSDVQGSWAGLGNINVNPCFVDPGYWDPNGTPEDANDDFWIDGDYHLKSQAGRWDASGKTWVIDANTSPCIDAGDMSSPIGYEPFPNGGRVNMGAYGGTTKASKSYFGQPVCETVVAGDINGDCRVDFLDFAFMAFHWLEGNNP